MLNSWVVLLEGEYALNKVKAVTGVMKYFSPEHQFAM